MMGACKRGTSPRFTRDPYPFNPMKTTPAPITIDSQWSGAQRNFRTERYPNADLVVAKWNESSCVQVCAFLSPGHHLDAKALDSADANYDRLMEAAENAARSAGDSFRCKLSVHFRNTPLMAPRSWYVALVPAGRRVGDTIADADDLFTAARRTEDVARALKQVRDVVASELS